MDFCFDIETLSKNTNGIVLSVAIVHFHFDEQPTYEELLKRTLFVKFDVTNQHSLGRTMSKETLDWWMNQSPEARNRSLVPSALDVDVVEGIGRINEYVKTHRDKHDMIWARGSLDQLLYDHLCNSTNQPLFANYNRWMCLRTALRLLKDTTDRLGYCPVPNFDKKLVVKHDPVHDVCYDVMQLIYGG